jgi:hypothetical protein
VLLYGFPPGVGATGTAALLNVPKSLERLVMALHEVRPVPRCCYRCAALRCACMHGLLLQSK